jgi:hypothetical protein
MLDKTVQDWKSQAADLTIEGRAFINGRHEDAMSGETRATVCPGDGHKLAKVANCGIEDADRAVHIARAAFEKGVWANMAPADRKMVLVRWAELIEDNADEIALLECLDVGKPISDTTGVDVPSAARTIRWSQGLRSDFPGAGGLPGARSETSIGRRRSHCPVELPSVHDCVEARTVIGNGQFGNPQTRFEHPIVGTTYRRVGD